MIILHEHRVPTGYWACPNCGTHNDPNVERCWECRADQDGMIEGVDCLDDDEMAEALDE